MQRYLYFKYFSRWFSTIEKTICGSFVSHMIHQHSFDWQNHYFYLSSFWNWMSKWSTNFHWLRFNFASSQSEFFQRIERWFNLSSEATDPLQINGPSLMQAWLCAGGTAKGVLGNQITYSPFRDFLSHFARGKLSLRTTPNIYALNFSFF